MSKAAQYVIVQTTVKDADQAASLATSIVERRFAACVQQWPIRSTYRWQGSIEHASEHVLAAKTTAVGARKLMDLIREQHTYDVPEIIVTPITDGATTYLNWLDEETTTDG